MKINYKINKHFRDIFGYCVGMKVKLELSSFEHKIISVTGDPHWKNKMQEGWENQGVLLETEPDGKISRQRGKDGKLDRGYFIKYSQINRVIK